MYQVFESIRVYDGMYSNLELHIARMQHSSKILWGKHRNMQDVMTALNKFHQQGLFKCKLQYNLEHHIITYQPYQKKKILHLQLILNNDILYDLKLSDRSVFDIKPPVADDTEIIFVRNGLLTDTRYSNIALWNGNEWHTPSKPLLNGTKRAALLREGIIKEAEIKIADIGQYQKISLINAMLDLSDIEVKIEFIYLP